MNICKPIPNARRNCLDSSRWLQLASFLILTLVVLPAGFTQITAHVEGADSPVVPPDSGAVGAPAKRLLQGNVEHSEVLPSLDERLKPGADYDENVLLQLGTAANDDWYWIPSWYAGKRHTEEALIVYRHDYNTGISTNPMQRQLERQDSISGYQRDRNGGIWDFNNTPYIQHVDSGLMYAVLYIKKMTPIEVSDHRIVLKYEEISVSYSKRNNKILESVQQEQINTITPLQPGAIRADISVKSFGWDGQPQRSEQSVIFANIVEPFHAMDALNDKDLRLLFRDYLVSHRKEELIPDDLKSL